MQAFVIFVCVCAGHVHAGNVLIGADGNCKLVDIENTIMGVPSIYRPYLVDIKRLRVSHSSDSHTELSLNSACNEPA